MTVTRYRIAIVALLIAVATLTSLLLTRPAASASTGNSTVSSFNDGFATSKQDDCQQGFAAACTWLQHTH